MTAFQVRCYINGVPDTDLVTVDAATALDAAEMTYGGPLTAIHRQQVHCRALVHSNRHKADLLLRACVGEAARVIVTDMARGAAWLDNAMIK